MSKLNLSKLINEFFIEYLPKKPDIEIYNEFSLQHEIGFFLREKLSDKYKIYFEKNIKSIYSSNTIKKEIDICIFNRNHLNDLKKCEKYAIELKFAIHDAIPEKMFSCVQDIVFMEQLKEFGFDNTACICVTTEPKLYLGKIRNDGIYRYFRGDNPSMITGRVDKPTGKTDKFLEIKGSYQVQWRKFDEDKPSNNRYYFIVL